MEESVEDLYVRALDLTLEKSYAEAVAAFEKVIERDPKYMDAYHGLAMTWMQMGNLDQAIAVEQRALVVNPDEQMSFSNLSVFYRKEGMVKEAEAAKGQATVLQWRREAKEKKKEI